MKEKGKRVLRYVLVILVLVIVVVVVLSQTLGKDAYSSAAAVRSHPVAKRDLENRITATGVFKPRSSAGVVSRVAAEVESIRVHEGDRVRQGEILVRLDDESYGLAYEQAAGAVAAAENGILQTLVTLRAGYRSARNALEQARRAHEKNEKLYEAEAISEEVHQKSLDAYQTALVNLQSSGEQLNLRSGMPLDAEPVLGTEKDDDIVASAPEVVQAKIALATAQNNLARCVIASPAAGAVTAVSVSEGDYVAAFTPLLQIASLDDMLAELEIDEVDIGKVRPGQTVEVSSDSIIGETLIGDVVEVAPVVRTLGSTRTSTVKVDIRENSIGPGVELKAGASCTARIVTSVKERAVVIPLSGFIEQSSVSYVYVMKPGEKRGEDQYYQLEKREIRTGISNVNFVEVTAGLEEGERIVVGNLNLMRDGIYVTAKEEE